MGDLCACMRANERERRNLVPPRSFEKSRTSLNSQMDPGVITPVNRFTLDEDESSSSYYACVIYQKMGVELSRSGHGASASHHITFFVPSQSTIAVACAIM